MLFYLLPAYNMLCCSGWVEGGGLGGGRKGRVEGGGWGGGGGLMRKIVFVLFFNILIC